MRFMHQSTSQPPAPPDHEGCAKIRENPEEREGGDSFFLNVSGREIFSCGFWQETPIFLPAF